MLGLILKEIDGSPGGSLNWCPRSGNCGRILDWKILINWFQLSLFFDSFSVTLTIESDIGKNMSYRNNMQKNTLMLLGLD